MLAGTSTCAARRRASCPTIRCRWTTTARSTRAASRRSRAATATTSPSTRSASPAIGATSRAVNVNTHRRGARFQLVHQPDRPAAPCRSTEIVTRAEPARDRGHRRLADRPGEEQRHHARLPRHRSHRPPVSGEVRPAEHPEMASGAEVIGAAIYHALGYNVVQGYVVDVDPARIVISDKATTVDMSGRRRPMRRDDVDRLLARGAKLPNGKYRATLSRFADGRPVGYFKYYGTRPDDPNDIHPHEHRRELRANRVFAAWLNHDDSRGINSLDMLDGPDGRKHIRPLHVRLRLDPGQRQHRGPGAAGRQRVHPRVGARLKTLATLGLWVRPWIKVDYWEEARVGRPVRGRLLRSRGVAAGVPQPRLRQPAAGRRLLGRAPGGAVLGRGDAGRGRPRRATASPGPPNTSRPRSSSAATRSCGRG